MCFKYLHVFLIKYYALETTILHGSAQFIHTCYKKTQILSPSFWDDTFRCSRNSLNFVSYKVYYGVSRNLLLELTMSHLNPHHLLNPLSLWYILNYASITQISQLVPSFMVSQQQNSQKFLMSSGMPSSAKHFILLAVKTQIIFATCINP